MKGTSVLRIALLGVSGALAMIVAPLLALATPSAQPTQDEAAAPALEKVQDFGALLDEAGLVLERGDDYDDVAVPQTPLYGFEKALKHRQLPLKIYFAVRPLARMKIEYEDPHSNAPNPDHIFPMVFQSLIGRLAKSGSSPSRVYRAQKAKQLFNADWAAAAMFDTEADLNSGFGSALLIAIHKSKLADAYYLFVFDDPKPLKPAIDAAIGALRFSK